MLVLQHAPADVWVVKESELGSSGQQIHCRTHLGHLLCPGDVVLGLVHTLSLASLCLTMMLFVSTDILLFFFYFIVLLFLLDCRFDLKNANINDDNCEKMKDENLPDVVSVVFF